MTVNQFCCGALFCTSGGAGVVAFERDAMLNGGAARMLYFDLGSLDPNLGGMLPADLDGQVLPPTSAPNLVIQIRSPFTQSQGNNSRNANC